MITYSIYNNTSGQFIETFTSNQTMDVPFFIMERTTVAGDYSDELFWVDVSVYPHVVMSKTEFQIYNTSLNIAGDNIETVTFSNIPAGTTFLDPERNKYTINDGQVSFSVDSPGVFNVQFKHLKHYSASFSVVAS